MAFTQSDIDTLKRAIATGVQRVTYSDGRSHEYRSLDEMKQALRMMQQDVEPDRPSDPLSRRVYAQFNQNW